MKNRLFSFSKTIVILLCGAFCLVTGLTSCEYFMNGQDIQSEILDSIAYNNAPTCKVYLKTDSKYGDFLSGTEKEFKVGYEAIIQFEVNSLEYVFKEFQAFNLDETQSRADLVEFTKLEDETSRDIYKYKVKILQQTDDIVIRPVCTPLPKIEEVTPKFESSGCDQDKPIKITFNKAMDPQSFGDFSCISISSDNVLNDYFETPVFTDDNKTLYIAAKTDRLILAPDGQKSIATVTIDYDFSQVKDAEGNILGIQGSHSYKINKNSGNQKKVTIRVHADDSAQGTFLSDGDKECYVDYTIEVQFTVKKADYRFIDFEIVSSADNSVSRADCVAEISKDYNEDTGIYRKKWRLVKEQNDILIRPECMPLPVVKKHSPESVSTEVLLNTPIIIEFNIPMEDEEVLPEDTLFTYDNIFLWYTDPTNTQKKMSDYFEPPVFDSTKTKLKLMPKPLELLDYIENTANVERIDIDVSLGSKIAVVKDGVSVPLKQTENSSFAVRYGKNKEETAPTSFGFFATSDRIDLDKPSSITDAVQFDRSETLAQITAKHDGDTYTDSQYKDKLFAHRVKDSVFIYGKYFDKDSGVKKVLITQDAGTTHEYYKGKAKTQFADDENGYTTFCIEFDLDEVNTASVITVQVLDACGNSAAAESFFVISKASYEYKNDMSFTVSNLPTALSETLFSGTWQYSDEALADFIDEYNSNLFTLKIYESNVHFKVIEDLEEAAKNIKFYCTYSNRVNRPFVYHKAAESDPLGSYWELGLDVTSIKGTDLLITAEDTMGATGQVLIKSISSLYTSIDDQNKMSFSELLDNAVLVVKNSGNQNIPKYYDDSDEIIDIGTGNEPVGLIFNKGGVYSEYVEFIKPTETLVVENYTFSQDANDRKATFTFNFGEDTWEDFDFIQGIIMCKVDDEYKEAERFIINRPADTTQTSLTYKVKNNWYYDSGKPEKFIFDGNCKIQFVGGLNSYLPGNDKIVNCPITDALSSVTYDDTPPEVTITHDLDKFTFKVKDEDGGSGINRYDCIKKLTIGRANYYFSTERPYDSGIFMEEIYVSDFYSYKTDGGTTWNVNYSYEVSDHAGNVIKVTDGLLCWDKDNIAVTMNDLSNDDYADSILSIDKLELGGRWGTCGIDVFDNSSDCFLRFYISDESPVNNKIFNKAPGYFYLGGSSSGDYDYILPNGNADDSIIVCSDAPVYAHALYTKVPYEECKNWSSYEWCLYGRTAREEFMPYSVDIDPDDDMKPGHSPRVFSVYSSIPKDTCYVIIVHFADLSSEPDMPIGKQLMSQVWQK